MFLKIFKKIKKEKPFPGAFSYFTEACFTVTISLSPSTQFAFAVVKIVWLCPEVTEPTVPAPAVSAQSLASEAIIGDC